MPTEAPCALRPLQPANLPESLALRVPHDRYAILITTDPVLSAQMPDIAWQYYCAVPAEQIVGRVLLRNYPLTRWEWFD